MFLTSELSPQKTKKYILKIKIIVLFVCRPSAFVYAKSKRCKELWCILSRSRALRMDGKQNGDGGSFKGILAACESNVHAHKSPPSTFSAVGIFCYLQNQCFLFRHLEDMCLFSLVLYCIQMLSLCGGCTTKCVSEEQRNIGLSIHCSFFSANGDYPVPPLQQQGYL